MTQRTKSEIFPTLKISVKPDDENGVEFSNMQVTIDSLKDLETTFGKKIVVTILKDEEKYDVFLNSTSQNNLIEAYGEDDLNWIGKICDLKKETNKKFKNDMIVFYPLK